MAVFIVLLFLTSGVLADHLPEQSFQDITELSSGSATALAKDPMLLNPHQDYSDIVDQQVLKSNKASTWCEFPFTAVGKRCLFFSDDQMNFSEAETYCEKLTTGHTHNITLAGLNIDNSDDQALLEEATVRDKSFWVGGKTEDSVNWKWISGEDVDLQSHFWSPSEPNEQDKQCIATKVTDNHIKRSYLYDEYCSESLNFICQTSTCPLGFRHVNNECYFISEEIGLPKAQWQEARDFCKGLSVPAGYHADLAVFDLSDINTDHTMIKLVENYPGDWKYIGLFEESECSFTWVDGRHESTTSNIWYPDNPNCGSEYHVVMFTSTNRVYFVATIGEHPFICKMLVDPTN